MLCGSMAGLRINHRHLFAHHLLFRQTSRYLSVKITKNIYAFYIRASEN